MKINFKINFLNIIAILFLLPASTYAFEIDQTGLKSAYLFDGLVTHGWENELSMGVRLNPSMRGSASLRYLNATQDPFSGIVHLRGEVTSGLFGIQWRTMKNYLFIDAQGGFDRIANWQTKPSGSLKVGITLPIPYNKFIQNLSLTPETWYTHAMFNGPAIKNRIASYGYATEVGWIMGPKMAGAIVLRQESLKPDSNLLNPDLTSVGLNGELHDLDVDTDTLNDNYKTSFYGYIYRQLSSALYLGYAFSWTSTRYDRRVLTDHSLVMGQSGGPPISGPGQQPGGPAPQIPIGSVYTWTYYPYPSPKEMLAHIASLTLDIPLGGVMRWKSNIAIPFYSRQEIRYLPTYFEYAWGGAYPEPAYDRNLYEFKTEKFTGPLTMGANLTWNPLPGTILSLAYDFFGFPYRKWAYFTEDSYSLQTVSFEVKQFF